MDQLRACKFTRFTDNFLTIGANPGNVDWFDDEGWQQIVEHWRIAAWAAKQSGLQGVALRPRALHAAALRSSATPPSRARKQHTFNEYAAQGPRSAAAR